LEEGKALKPPPPALAEALTSQNAGYAPSPARDEHLRALGAGAPAVVTGQQAGLLLGPLYTLYKAATAIRLARSKGVVPVFWLQTEDHDLAEIAVANVARPRGGALRLALPADPEPVSIAHRTLPDAISEILARLADALRGLPETGPHLERLARHYRPGAGFGAAFAGVLAELFSEEGLVLLDPRDPVLAPLAAPVHRRALLEWREIAAALHASGARESVHVRDDAPLSFFHPDGSEGRRCRLRWNGDRFAEIGGAGTHTLDELLAALAEDPLRFSTSALLRPILQDTWLDTAAYVGGPAEVEYFEQLGPLYDRFSLPRPDVVRRASLRLLEEDDRVRLERAALRPEEAGLPLDDVLSRCRAREEGTGGEAVATRLIGAIDRALEEVAPALRETGERAERAAAKTRGTVARAVEKLGRNVDKARRLRDRTFLEDLERLRERLFPGGVPQERFYGISYFAARYGERAFVERVLGAAEPGGGTRDLWL
jgi:bacillithiol biosynthesis cysteine-adding enzyme BshC